MAGPPEVVIDRIRRLLLLLLFLGMAGTAAELWFMGHYEDWWQLAPFAVIGMSLLMLVWFGVSRAPWPTRLFRLSMVLLMAAGLTGAVLHYRANMEFQLEMDPSMRGMALLLKVLHAKAPPALAPANMALLGLIGLVSTVGVTRPGRY